MKTKTCLRSAICFAAIAAVVSGSVGVGPAWADPVCEGVAHPLSFEVRGAGCTQRLAELTAKNQAREACIRLCAEYSQGCPLRFKSRKQAQEYAKLLEEWRASLRSDDLEKTKRLQEQFALMVKGIGTHVCRLDKPVFRHGQRFRSANAECSGGTLFTVILEVKGCACACGK